MMAMKRIITVLFLFVALATAVTAESHSNDAAHPRREGGLTPDTLYRTDRILRRDTIMRTDTVVTIDTVVRREIVSRTDVIRRTEVVVRLDSLPDSAGFNSGSLEISPVAGGNQAADVVLPAIPGGRYVWVPDTVATPDFSSGAGFSTAAVALPSLKEARSAAEVDVNEMVTFRGDTIPMMLRDRNLGRFNRGLFNYLFIPKGIWQIGLTASYGEIKTEDLELLSLMSDIDIYGHIFSVRPYFAYFINNNMSVGMRLSYTSGKGNISSFNVDIDEDMNFNLKDIWYESEGYTAALTFNQYYGIARRGRFGIFNEVELAFSSGRSDFSRPYNGVLKQTHTTTTQIGLNFSPGVSVFIMEPVSFNVSFGVFGLSMKNEKQTVDGVKAGSRFTSGANFHFNIFNINFGVAANF